MWEDHNDADSTVPVRSHQECSLPSSASEHTEMFPELALHLRQLSDQDLIDPENLEDRDERKNGNKKITLNVPGTGEVHKSTIFALLNSDPKGLSTDRLRRVRSKVAIQAGCRELESEELSLFDDVGLYIKDKDRPPTFMLGRVLRMRNMGRGTVEYKKQVSLKQQDQYPKLKILTNLYTKVGSTFIYNCEKITEFSIENVIAKVKLTINDDKGFDLSRNDEEVLTEFIQNVTQKSKRVNSRCQNKSHSAESRAADGRAVVLVDGNSSGDVDGRQRSRRKRKAIFFEVQ